MWNAATRFQVCPGCASTDRLIPNKIHEELKPMSAIFLNFNQSWNICVSSLQANQLISNDAEQIKPQEIDETIGIRRPKPEHTDTKNLLMCHSLTTCIILVCQSLVMRNPRRRNRRSQTPCPGRPPMLNTIIPEGFMTDIPSSTARAINPRPNWSSTKPCSKQGNLNNS